MAELPSSKLGTKSHWIEVYKGELEVFEDIGDEGEIWFGEHTLMKLVNWLEWSELVNRASKILDIGCGNGLTLVALAKRNFSDLTGCDYAMEAVELAKEIAQKKNIDINYLVVDILNLDSSSLKGRYFDVCIDKGTYDAISLNPDNANNCRLRYKQSVCELLKKNGVFALASCNWTLQELTEFFSSDFELLEDLPSPKFTFGGATGQNVTSSIWRKKRKK